MDLSSIIFLAAIIALLFLLKIKLPKDRFYLLLISSAISLILVEGICRWQNIASPWGLQYREDVADSAADGYAYVPFGKLEYRYPDNPRGYFDEQNRVVGHINGQGFRGSDVAMDKTGATPRIAFLGDSFTLGFGVKDEHTMPVQFATHLASKYRIDAEALNFGVTDTATDDQIRLLEKYVLRFHPDVVVVDIFLNDANRKGTINFLTEGLYFRWLRRKSYFLNGIISSPERILVHRAMVEHYLEGYLPDSPGWVAMQAALRHAKMLASQHGSRLVVTIYPVLVQLNDAYPFTEIHETINKFCRDESIVFFDLKNVFLKRVDSELWVHRTDQHPNEFAQALAGQFLADKFVENGLVGKSSQ